MLNSRILTLYLHIHPSIHPFVRPSVRPSIYPPSHPSILQNNSTWKEFWFSAFLPCGLAIWSPVNQLVSATLSRALQTTGNRSFVWRRLQCWPEIYRNESNHSLNALIHLETPALLLHGNAPINWEHFLIVGAQASSLFILGVHWSHLSFFSLTF